MSGSQPKLEKVWRLLEESSNQIAQDRLDDALKNMKEAATIVNNSGSVKEVHDFNAKLRITTDSVLNVAFQLASKTNYQNANEKAVQYLEIACFFFSQIKDYATAPHFEFYTALALTRWDKFVEAIPHYLTSEKLWKQINDFKKAASPLINMGYVLLRLGKDSEAKTAYEKAIKILQEFPPSEERADAEAGLGRVLDSFVERIEARKHYEIAEKIFIELKVPKGKIADIKLDLGRNLLGEGKCQEASQYFVEAEEVYGEVGDATGVAKVKLNMAEVCAKGFLMDSAIAYLTSALSTFEELGNISETRLAYEVRGLAHYYSFDFKNASSDLEKSLKIGDRILMGDKSPELRISHNKEFHIVPDALCSSYLALFQKTRDFDYMTRAFNTLELAKSSTVAEALLGEESRFLRVPEIRKELINEEDRLLNLISQQQSKLLDLASLRETNKKKFRSSYKFLESQIDNSYDKLEALRLRVMLECADIGSAPIPRSYNVLEETFAVFPKQEKWAVLEFGLLSSMQKLVVFLIENTGFFSCTPHTVDLQYLQELAKRCMDVPEKLRLDSASAEDEVDKLLESLSKELYSAILPPPVALRLKAIKPDYLIIIPQSYLNWIPFEIIHDGDEYWGLKYSMSTAFSLDLARICVEKRKRGKSQTARSILFIKDPTLDLDDTANSELKGLKVLIESNGFNFSSPPIEREQATQKAVLEAFNNDEFDIMHYSGHALFLGKNPSQSSLQLHAGNCATCKSGSLYGKHECDFLSANEIIYNVRFKLAPIVYLSACETGISEVEPGDEMFGLVRALIYAGATSLVLSHWGLANDVAPIFAEEFYSQLFEGKSVAVALRNARKRIAKNYSISDWSILTLHGDPFRTLNSPS